MIVSMKSFFKGLLLGLVIGGGIVFLALSMGYI